MLFKKFPWYFFLSLYNLTPIPLTIKSMFWVFEEAGWLFKKVTNWFSDSASTSKMEVSVEVRKDQLQVLLLALAACTCCLAKY